MYFFIRKLMIILLVIFGRNAFGQIVHIPDPNFKINLIKNILINTNGDSEIQESEAIAYNGAIEVVSSGINDLTGIGAFVNLKELRCDNNPFTHIDLSKNKELVLVSFVFNHLKALDLSNNKKLESVFCNASNIESINIQNGYNTQIKAFVALNNPNLKCIQVDNVAASIANLKFLIDATAEYSEDCYSAAAIQPKNIRTTINIFPNPVNDLLHVDCSGWSLSTKINIKIFDIYSKEIMSTSVQSLPTNIIELSALNSGLYLLEISDQSYKRFKYAKFIKN